MSLDCHRIDGLPRFYDDSTPGSGDAGLFDHSEVERIRVVGQNLTGRPTAEKDPSFVPSKPLYKRIWKALTFPFCRVIQKIVAVVRWVFPFLFKKKASSSTNQNQGGVATTQRFCSKTLDELVKDHTFEAKALKKDVENLKFDDPQNTVAGQMQKLSRLHFLHYEIVEAFRSIDGLINDNKKALEEKGITIEQAKELRKLLFQLNATYLQLKKTIAKNARVIGVYFFNISNSDDIKNPEDRDLWFLRTYYSILKFMLIHHKQLSETPSRELKSLDLAHEALPPDSSLISKVSSIIGAKERELRKKQEELEAKALESFCGIANIGNSCYMNSCLQVLLGTRLEDILDRKPRGREESPVKQALKTFRDVYRLGDRRLRDKSIESAAFAFRRSVVKSGLAPGINKKTIRDQHDAPELMGALLSVVDCHFDLQITTKSLEGEKARSVDVEPLHLLQLPIGDRRATMQEAIDSCRVVDTRDEDNPWIKDGVVYSCYRREYQIKNKIPDVLVIQVMRMGFDKKKERSKKVGTRITWDSDSVDLREWVDSSLIKKGTKTTYRIAAYINHRGDSVGFGHYTANVRKGNKFYRCDDNSPVFSVSSTEENEDREQAYLFVLERDC